MIGLHLPRGELRLLCLGAHPDDIEIGCGATLLTLAKARQVRATAVIMSGTGDRRDEALGSTPAFLPGAEADVHVLGLPDGRLPAHWGEVKQALENVATRVHPDIVFAPRPDDAHQDHRLLAELVPTVWRDSLILGYEIPKWDGDVGRVTHYVQLTDDDARRKIELLNTCFPSQYGRDWWSDETFRSLMRLRGMECRSPYAEGFFVTKAVLDMHGGDAHG